MELNWFFADKTRSTVQELIMEEMVEECLQFMKIIMGQEITNPSIIN